MGFADLVAKAGISGRVSGPRIQSFDLAAAALGEGTRASLQLMRLRNKTTVLGARFGCGAEWVGTCASRGTRAGKILNYTSAN